MFRFAGETDIVWMTTFYMGKDLANTRYTHAKGYGIIDTATDLNIILGHQFYDNWNYPNDFNIWDFDNYQTTGKNTTAEYGKVKF